MLMAGIDGIRNQIDPGPPLDKDIYDMSPEELKNVPSMPGSLEESLQALENDYDFLLANEVFTGDLIERWIDYKRGHEINPVRMRPHPIEFSMYFDA
jgi:glutamine synthetase